MSKSGKNATDTPFIFKQTPWDEVCSRRGRGVIRISLFMLDKDKTLSVWKLSHILPGLPKVFPSSLSSGAMKKQPRARGQSILYTVRYVLLLVGLVVVVLAFERPSFGQNERRYIKPPTTVATKTRDEMCRSLFLQGVEPQAVYQRSALDISLLEQWADLHCDNLFCESTNNATRTCKWTSFAVDSLLAEAQEICRNERLSEFLADPEWKFYRFADLFKHYLDFQTDADEGSNQLLRDRYAGSIMDEYSRISIFRHGKQAASDYKLLKEVVEKRISAMTDIPPADAAVIHLRLGDVLEAAVEPVSDMLREQQYFYRENRNVTPCRCEPPWQNPTGRPLLHSWNAYVRPLSYFSSIDWRNFSSVVIMGSAHLGLETTNAPVSDGVKPVASCEYTYALKTYLQRLGIRVTMRLGKPPEDDIVFASQARTFVVTGGGFSRLLGKLSAKFGAQVLSIPRK